MSKHTPGPWRFLEVEDHDSDENICRQLTICGPSGDDLANVYSSDDSTVSISREEAVANARLIASAPDLLEALQEARRYLDAVVANSGSSKRRENYGGAVRRIDAAIAKAEGSTSTKDTTNA